MKHSGIKKFITETILFLSPFLLLIGVEIFILPIDFFTYRSWEALKVDSKIAQFFLPGPFYPNQDISKIEFGDLGFRTPYAEGKVVTWRTDDWGFRANSGSKEYDILLVGDSTLVGTGLDQDEMLASVIDKKSGHVAYPMGAKELANVLYNPHFKEKPPKVVVLVSIERFISNLSLSMEEDSDSKFYFQAINFIERSGLNWTSGIFVNLDRLLKQGMYHSLRAEVDNFFNPKKPAFIYGNPPALFFQGDFADQNISDERIIEIAENISDAAKIISKAGAKFIFLPVPNKETAYWNLLPSRKKPTFLPRLIRELNKRGVTSVDTQSEFLKAINNGGEDLYHKDDTHWNAGGVSLAADLLLREIEK